MIRITRFIIAIFVFVPLFSFSSTPFEKKIQSLKPHFQTAPDSVLQVLDALQNDNSNLSEIESIKVENLKGLCFYYKRNYLQAIKIYQAALKKSKIIEDSTLIANQYFNIGLMYYFYGNYTESINYYSKVDEINQLREGTMDVNQISFNIGNTYLRKGYYVTAMLYYYKALNNINKTLDTFTIAKIYSNIAICQINTELYKKSMATNQKVLKIYKNLNAKDRMPATLINIGTTQIRKKEYKQAKVTYLKALKISQRTGDSVNMGNIYNCLGQLAYQAKQFPLAKEYLHKAIAISVPLNLKIIELDAKVYLAKISFDQGQRESALREVKKIYNYFRNTNQESNRSYIVEYGKMYSNLLFVAKRRKKAYEILKYVLKIKKEDAIQKRKLLLTDLETKNKIDQQHNQIKLDRKDEKVNTLEYYLKKSNLRLYVIGGSLLLIIILGLMQFMNYRKKQKYKALRLTLKNRDKELSKYAMLISEKNKFLKTLIKDFKPLKKEEKFKPLYANLIQHINVINTEADHLQEKANKYYYPLISYLRNNYPSVTDKDIRLCNLILLGFSSKEIASIFNISPSSVDMQRHRFRSKVEIPSQFSIKQWLEDVNIRTSL